MTTLEKPPDAFALHTLLEGCTAEVALNDVPLSASERLRIQDSVHATPWVIDGVNQLRIRVEATTLRLEDLPVGLVARDREAGPVRAWARVMSGRYAEGVPDPERDATPLALTWGPTSHAQDGLPCTVSGTFLASGRPRWGWQDARPLDPGASDDRSKVLAFVRELADAFGRGDAAAVLARMPTLVRESVHFGDPAGGFAAGFAAEMANVASEPGYEVAPFRDDEVVLRPIAGGRVLRVVDATGDDLLRSTPRMETAFRFRLDLAMIDGRLELARIA
jgi:hypothetical protein